MPSPRPWIEPFRNGFRVRYRDAQRRKKDISPISRFDKKSEANAALNKWIESRLKQATGETDLDISVSVLFDRWLIDSVSGLANKKGKVIKSSTIETYRSSFRYILEHIDSIGQLNAFWVEEYKRHLFEVYAGWTPHRRLVDLKSFCSYLRRKKIINWDPFETVVISKPASRARFYSDDEIFAFEDSAIRLHDLKGLLYIRLGHLCGFRHGEATRLRLEDIHPDPENSGWGTITLWESETKNESSRVLPAPPKVLELIVQLSAKRRQGLVFEGWTDKQFEYRWARIIAGAGFAPTAYYVNKFKWAKGHQDRGECPFHGLRHTFCRQFIENGGDVSELQHLTGHRDSQVLMKTYAHFSNKHLRLRSQEVYARIQSRLNFVGQMGGKLTEIIGSMGSNEGHNGAITMIAEKNESDRFVK